MSTDFLRTKIAEAKRDDEAATKGRFIVRDRDSGDPLRPKREVLREFTFVEGLEPATYIFADILYPTSMSDTVGAEERAANARRVANALNREPLLAAALEAALDVIAEAQLTRQRLISEGVEPVGLGMALAAFDTVAAKLEGEG